VANRDLKLENLLLEKEPSGVAGDWPLLKICDFGAPTGLLPEPAASCQLGLWTKGANWLAGIVAAAHVCKWPIQMDAALLVSWLSTATACPACLPAGYSKHELNSTAKTVECVGHGAGIGLQHWHTWHSWRGQLLCQADSQLRACR
jgi:serine/threonine protein kinase